MRYIAFLRAINVGGHLVKMDRLRQLFEELKFTKVETFIASGNVIFDSPSTDASALELKIERHLKKALGYDVETFLRTCAEVAAVAKRAPFEVRDGCGEYVVFMRSSPDKATKTKIMSLRTADDDFHAHQREVYWQSRGRFAESPAAVPFGKAFAKQGTMRNVSTVRKLAAKYGG